MQSREPSTFYGSIPAELLSGEDDTQWNTLAQPNQDGQNHYRDVSNVSNYIAIHQVTKEVAELSIKEQSRSFNGGPPPPSQYQQNIAQHIQQPTPYQSQPQQQQQQQSPPQAQGNYMPLMSVLSMKGVQSPQFAQQQQHPPTAQPYNPSVSPTMQPKSQTSPTIQPKSQTSPIMQAPTNRTGTVSAGTTMMPNFQPQQPNQPSFPGISRVGSAPPSQFPTQQRKNTATTPTPTSHSTGSVSAVKPNNVTNTTTTSSQPQAQFFPGKTPVTPPPSAPAASTGAAAANGHRLFTIESFYYPSMNQRAEIEAVLVAAHQKGNNTFLIRTSPTAKTWVLSKIEKGLIGHFMIEITPKGSFRMKGLAHDQAEHPTLQDLINYLANLPLECYYDHSLSRCTPLGLVFRK